MQAALKRAGLAPSDIDYVNAHGTSTPLGDLIETKAVARLLGDAAANVSISSTKSATGICLVRRVQSRRFTPLKQYKPVICHQP